MPLQPLLTDQDPPVSNAAPPRPAPAAEPVGDAVLDAAAACIQRKGFDNTSLEEVAAEAGVSRTTLYRRFGSRENLFKALLNERSKPFRLWSRQILFGPGLPEERLETVLAHAILEMQHVGWLDYAIGPGISAAGRRLIKAAHADGAGDTLAPLLEMMMSASARDAGFAVADLLEWTAEQMISLANAKIWEEEPLRQRLRHFVMPVLIPRMGEPGPAADRLTAIEEKVDRLLARQQQG